jgi:hypothetical protein
MQNSRLCAAVVHIAESALRNKNRRPSPDFSWKAQPTAELQAEIGRARHFQMQNCKLQNNEGCLAPGECEVHLHLGFNFNRFAVQQIRLILPLFHRLDGSRRQHGMSADQL